MGQSVVRKVLVVGIVIAVSMSALVLTVPNARAATWTIDTDTDFNSGTITDLEVVGTGTAAYLRLLMNTVDWKEEMPLTDPGAREGPAMAYDSTNDVVVLFGGYGGLNLNDTWEYTPGTNTWAKATTVVAPTPRAYSGMTFDSTNNRIVLFGGLSDMDYESDTWEYNAATDTWVDTTAKTSPPKMSTNSMAFVQPQGRVLLFGQNRTSLQMETWAYDASTNAWTDRAPSAQPSVRTGPALAYDGVLDRVVLFGGFDGTIPPGTLMGDTWEYNWGTNTWTRTATTGPDARVSAGLTYRWSIPAVVLFGGRSGATYYTDTWRYPNSAGSRQWEMIGTQASPPGRVLLGICDETPVKKSFIYGGALSGGGWASDTWSLGPAYQLQGSLITSAFDSGGANVNWNTISWVGTSSPPTTVLRFQIATSNDPAGPWSYYGPGGSTSAYYTVSGTAIWTGHDNQRYARVFVQLYTLDDTTTSTMDSFTIDYTVPASSPYIIWTDPYHTQNSVPTSKSISIRFSETMNTGSVTFTINPSVATTSSWSESNSRLTLDHAAPLQQCKLYTVTVTAGTDLGGNPLIPGSVPNPFVFSTVCIPPEITATSPIHGAIDVALNANIVIDFSEPMNKTSVSPNISPSIPLTATWSNADQRVTYSHTTDFQQCLDYTVNVTGKDVDGSNLVPGTVPNPFSFRAICTTPYVVSTTPSSLQIDIPLGQNIVVTFSEQMNTASVVAAITPTIALTPTWSNGDKTVTYSHSNFPTCTGYSVTMTGKDLDGNDLWAGKFDGFADNPWQFATICTNPFIWFTIPANGTIDVNRLADINVQFSKQMNNASVTWAIQPAIALTSSWDTENKVLTLSHTEMFVCGVNQVTITGRDTSGNSLRTVLAPNPFYFTPLCPNPYILSTDPVNGTFGVPVNKNIVVTFNKPMKPSSLIQVLTPPDVTLTPTWSVGDTVLTLSHVSPFQNSKLYQVYVDGTDVDGNGLIPGGIPDPFEFTTAGLMPQILSTVPADGATGVALGQNIVVTFSEAMNIGTVSCTSVPSVTYSPSWSGGNTVLTLAHATPFTAMTLYTVTCVGQDMDGNSLVAGPVPNPWSFTTGGGVPPQITDTVPPDGATGVALGQSIIVTFSEAMNTATATYLIVPSVTLNPTWSVGNTVLTLSHVAPFSPATMYTVTINGEDMDGNSLVPGSVPNPWLFTTTTGAPSPPGGLQITRVQPSTVRLTWNSVTGADLYRIYESADRFAAWPWAVLDTTTATTYDANHLNDGLTHYYVVRAERTGIESTNSTMAVKIAKNIGYSPSSANIYWFSLPYHSSYSKASDISTELTSSKVKVVAKWNPAKQSPTLWYYFRGKWRGTDFTIGAGDGLYVGSVSSFSWVIVGTDGTATLSLNFNSPPKKNVNWISMPYTGTYSKASDIANELTSSKVTEIGLWNPATQTTVRYYWTGSAWTGTDFQFVPGDGIYITIATSFTWQPKLITPEVP